MFAPGDALSPLIDLLVDREEEGVLTLIRVKVRRFQFVFEALTRCVVLLDDLNQLVGLQFLLVKDVALLEKVDNFGDIKGNVFFEAE